MARRKKTSSLVLDSSQARAAGLESIDPQLDLGGELTLANFRAAIVETQGKLAAYNTLLSQVDEAANGFADAERKLRDMRDRTLAGVAAKFGRNSPQYQMAGGTRSSERKRRLPKAATATATPAAP
jgi:hypothetical protein